MEYDNKWESCIGKRKSQGKGATFELLDEKSNENEGETETCCRSVSP